MRWVIAGVLLVAAFRRSDTHVSDAEIQLAARTPPIVDHHQHLFSPAVADLARQMKQEPITAAKLVGMLDEAGIRRAVVLSEGFWFDSRVAALTNPQP